MSASRQRFAKRKLLLTSSAVSDAIPHPKSYVVWDEKLTGFGLRVSPGGTKSFFVQYRTGEGRRTDANRKSTLGRFPMLSPSSARKQALALLGAVRVGSDPSRERARVRAIPTLDEAVEDWLRARTGLEESSLTRYQSSIAAMLEGWSNRRLDELTREDVARRFAEVTQRHGWTQANKGMKVLGAVYRRSGADYPALRDPVALWAAAGGRLHPSKRRQIEAPADVLPAWVQGIESAVRHSAHSGSVLGRDSIPECGSMRCAVCTGSGWTFLSAQCAWTGPRPACPWCFRLPANSRMYWSAAGQRAQLHRRTTRPRHGSSPPSRSRSGRVGGVNALYRSIERHGGKPFWFHAMRNCFITIGSRDLLLPESSGQTPDKPPTLRRRCDTGICGRLDSRAVARPRAAHRGPDRRAHCGPRRYDAGGHRGRRTGIARRCRSNGSLGLLYPPEIFPKPVTTFHRIHNRVVPKPAIQRLCQMSTYQPASPAGNSTAACSRLSIRSGKCGA